MMCRQLLLVLHIICSSALANVNLWLSQAETSRLLGLSTEIFYVQEGLVNQYASNFNLPIPPNVTNLHFNWQSTSSYKVLYEIRLAATDRSLLSRLTLSVPSRGAVPIVAGVFTVNAPCRLHTTGETELRLSVRFVAPPTAGVVGGHQRQLTAATETAVGDWLLLRRRRVCRSDATAVETRQNSTILLGSAQSGSDTALHAAIGCVCGVAVVAVLVVTSLVFRRKTILMKQRSRGEISEDKSGQLYMQVPTRSGSVCSMKSDHEYACVESVLTSGGDQLGYVSPKNRLVAPLSPRPAIHLKQLPPSTAGSTQHSSSSSRSRDRTCSSSGSGSRDAVRSGGRRVREVGQKVAELMVDSDCLQLETVVYQGSYSRITVAWMQASAGHKERYLAKSLTGPGQRERVSQFLQDGTVFYQLRHRNLQTISAVAFKPQTTPMLLFPYIRHYNLKRFLHGCSFGSGPSPCLDVRDVADISEQICQALGYLHQQNIPHTDVATRNCCLDDSLHVKLADKACSADMFPEDYVVWHVRESSLLLPVKWTPPEVLTGDPWSMSSDSWSFGVLLWELVTLAQQPYSELSSSELLGFLGEGYRLSQPDNCPDQLFSIMAFCWRREPHQRPTSSRILDYIHSFSRELNNCI